MGMTSVAAGDLFGTRLPELARDWPAAAYRTSRRNCVHFCAHFCSFLGVMMPVPQRLYRLAESLSWLCDTFPCVFASAVHSGAGSAGGIGAAATGGDGAESPRSVVSVSSASVGEAPTPPPPLLAASPVRLRGPTLQVAGLLKQSAPVRKRASAPPSHVTALRTALRWSGNTVERREFSHILEMNRQTQLARVKFLDGEEHWVNVGSLC